MEPSGSGERFIDFPLMTLVEVLSRRGYGAFTQDSTPSPGLVSFSETMVDPVGVVSHTTSFELVPGKWLVVYSLVFYGTATSSLVQSTLFLDGIAWDFVEADLQSPFPVDSQTFARSTIVESESAMIVSVRTFGSSDVAQHPTIVFIQLA